MNSKLSFHKILLITIILSLLLFGLSLNSQVAQAHSVLHPTFPFLDKNGVNVLVFGEPVSTMETCGSC
ncbi:MAG: hypothetical protein N2D54_04080, partial [Chloroflexota bacterium]